MKAENFSRDRGEQGKPVLILGAGGQAKVLLDILLMREVEILGLTDAAPSAKETVLGVPVLGGDDRVLDYSPEEVLLVNALGSIGSTLKREEVFRRFKALGYSFASVLHPSAVISCFAVLGEGVQIMAGAVVQAGSTLGDNVLVNTRASVDHDCRIGAHTHLAPGATLSGGVVLAPGVHVGTGATLVQGITLGEGSIVGAGAAVLNNVPARATVAGVPARVLG